jgi:hypothetical protein
LQDPPFPAVSSVSALVLASIIGRRSAALIAFYDVAMPMMMSIMVPVMISMIVLLGLMPVLHFVGMIMSVIVIMGRGIIDIPVDSVINHISLVGPGSALDLNVPHTQWGHWKRTNKHSVHVSS